MPQYLQYPPFEQPSSGGLDMPGPRMLISEHNGHRLTLPEDSELILGRFDPDNDDQPDVDLTAEDEANWGISRHHAKIIGWRSQYEIEDLGSSRGTWVNETRLELQTRHPINIGDSIRLGGCTFWVARPPSIWKIARSQHQEFIYVCFTGHYYPFPHQDSVIVGRTDTKIDFRPDIDLSDEEDSIACVSRRHVKITLHREQWMVEDLGSKFGTKLNGEKIFAGIKVPIYPGQHLWLGGYTIAFDVIERLGT